MKHRLILPLVALGLSALLIAPGCKTTQAGAGKGTATRPKARVITTPGCIKGRVVNSNGKGFKGVLISTNPATSPEVTGARGFFEICYMRKVVDPVVGETVKAPIPLKKYKLKAEKDGYHARPVVLDYKGKSVKLHAILMVEATRPLPEGAVKTSMKAQKRSSGAGKAPKDE